jgi:hypothetical protein
VLLVGHRSRPPSGPTARRRRLAVGLAVALPLVVLTVPTTSYLTALTAPGSTDWQTTSVEWLRDHGGGPAVDAAENWWYAHNRPTGGAPAAETLPTVAAPTLPSSTSAPFATAAGAAHPPNLPLPAGRPPLPHEAQWVPDPDGSSTAALYSAYFRPDPAYPSQVVGVAWMDQDLTATHLLAGTAEPVAGTSPAAAQVPQDLRRRLLAVFNSGW